MKAEKPFFSIKVGVHELKSSNPRCVYCGFQCLKLYGILPEAETETFVLSLACEKCGGMQQLNLSFDNYDD